MRTLKEALIDKHNISKVSTKKYIEVPLNKLKKVSDLKPGWIVFFGDNFARVVVPSELAVKFYGERELPNIKYYFIRGNNNTTLYCTSNWYENTFPKISMKKQELDIIAVLEPIRQVDLRKICEDEETFAKWYNKNIDDLKCNS